MASALRTAVEEEGGELITTVRALRDGYGFSQLTAAARAHIAGELAKQGLETHPPIEAAAPEDTVAVRVRSLPRFPATARSRPGGAAPAAGAGPPAGPEARRRWWARGGRGPVSPPDAGAPGDEGRDA